MFKQMHLAQGAVHPAFGVLRKDGTLLLVLSPRSVKTRQVTTGHDTLYLILFHLQSSAGIEQLRIECIVCHFGGQTMQNDLKISAPSRKKEQQQSEIIFDLFVFSLAFCNIRLPSRLMIRGWSGEGRGGPRVVTYKHTICIGFIP